MKINDSTVVTEFSYNYYIPPNSKCAHAEDDRYCVLVRWSDFASDPNAWIDRAFDKRSAPHCIKNEGPPLNVQFCTNSGEFSSTLGGSCGHCVRVKPVALLPAQAP